MFSLKLKLFDFTSLRQGQFLANDRERQKKQILKSIEQGHTEGTFSLPCKIPTLCLVGGQAPNPKKQKQRQNGTRCARVFSKAKAR